MGGGMLDRLRIGKLFRRTSAADAAARAVDDAEALRRFASISNEWYWEQDETLRFTSVRNWNPRAAGIEPEALIGHTLAELAAPDEALERQLEACAARQPYESFRCHLQIGDRALWLSLNGVPSYDSEGRFCGYIGTGREVSKQTAIERALRERDTRFREILDLMPVAVFVKDADSRLVFLNSECEAQWGTRSEDVRGTDASSHFPPSAVETYLASDRRAFEERRAIDYEETVWHAGHRTECIVHTYKKPIFDNAGKPRYLIGVRVDMTDKKVIERKLRASEQLLRNLAFHQAKLLEDERRRIARDVHDELGQNLLAVRIDASRLAARTAVSNERLHKAAADALHTIDETIRSVRQIINNLRPPVLDLGLSAALQWLAREFERHGTSRCTVEIGTPRADELLSEASATVMFRLAQEALTNIRKHACATEVCIRLDERDGNAWLAIEDNGIGMNVRARRTAQGGFGLVGMRERVKALGGSLQVESEPGAGMVLRAAIPIVALSETRETKVPAGG
ncbi:PAS domain S-box protein [Oxalobacteraceae bacterium OM1]|nr:PAS domain S-box protein [Oxalobacteraceae bacterium OM1]